MASQIFVGGFCWLFSGCFQIGVDWLPSLPCFLQWKSGMLQSSAGYTIIHPSHPYYVTLCLEYSGIPLSRTLKGDGKSVRVSECPS